MGLLDTVTFFCKNGELILHPGGNLSDKQIMTIMIYIKISVTPK